MLLHMCRCGRLIPQTMRLCEDCEAKAGQRYKDYNEHRRDSKTAAFYVSKEWRQMRGLVLSAYDYIDLYALNVLHEIRRADTVHHITEITEDWTRRLDAANLIPIASSTHNAIHTLYDKDAATKAATQATLRQLLAAEPRRVGYQNCFREAEKVPLPIFRGENSPPKNPHIGGCRVRVLCHIVTQRGDGKGG